MADVRVISSLYSIGFSTSKYYLPSSSKVANVSRLSLLLKHDSGMPLLDTVVNGTKQSSIRKSLNMEGS